MKKTLTAVLLLAALCVSARAQAQTATGGARLIDSFGEIQLSDLMARLDYYAVELQNDPGARGVIAAYGASNKFPGWSMRRLHMSRQYLVSTRGLEEARVSAVYAGLRDETAFELWLVPAGAAPPVTPFDLALLMSGARSPLPFDRFTVIERGDRSESEYGDVYPDAPRLYDLFAEALLRDPTLRGCVVGYTSRRGARAADRRIASRAKMSIVKSHAVDVRRILTVGGGRREYKMIELWLVPPGATLPEPSPEFPRRAKRR
jgi:hypothetical protein